MNPLLLPLFTNPESKSNYTKMVRVIQQFGIKGEKYKQSNTIKSKTFQFSPNHDLMATTNLSNQYSSILRKKKRQTSKAKTFSKHGNFLPRINSSKTLKKSKQSHHPRTVKKSASSIGTAYTSKNFEKYLKEIRKTDKIRHKHKSRTSTPILPPHLKVIEQQSFQTQSFAPKQVYANTINININNNTSNKLNEEKHLDPFWKQPLQFPDKMGYPTDLHSYRQNPDNNNNTNSKPETGPNVSINEWINQYTKDKELFTSLHTFTRYKLQQLYDLFHKREIVSHSSTPRWGGHVASKSKSGSRSGSRKFMNHEQLLYKRTHGVKSNKIITETSFKSALCIDILSQIAAKSDAKYSETLELITTELSKNIFYPPLINKTDGLFVDTKDDGDGNKEFHDYDEKWFDDTDNLTLEKLSGLRNYREKYEYAASRLKKDFVRLKAASKWTDTGKHKEWVKQQLQKVWTLWVLTAKRAKVARKISERLCNHKRNDEAKKWFALWRCKSLQSAKIHTKRIIYRLQFDNEKLNGEREILKEIEADLHEQIHKLQTALSIMADHLYCEKNKECEQRTALRVHKMLKQLKLTLQGRNSVLKELGFEEYLSDFPSQQQLAAKFEV